MYIHVHVYVQHPDCAYTNVVGACRHIHVYTCYVCKQIHLTLLSVQASVSVKRVGAFLRSEELDPDIVDWQRQPAMGKRTTTKDFLKLHN